MMPSTRTLAATIWPRRYYAAALVVLAVAAALRFYNLDTGSLWLDEAAVAENSKGTFWEVALYTRHRNSSPVLYPYLLWAVQLVESSAFSVRLIPALSSVLMVAVLLFLLPLVGVARPTAFVAGLLAALSVGAMYAARDAREYGVDALIASLLIVAMLAYLRRGTKWPVCAALFIALMLQYGLALFGVAVISAIVILLKRGGVESSFFRSARVWARELLPMAAAFAIGCIVALVTLSGQWSGAGWAADAYLRESYYHGAFYDLPALAMFLGDRIWLALGSQVSPPVVALGLVALVAFLVTSWKRLHRDAILTLFLLTLAIASLAALLAAYPLGDVRQVNYMGPVMFVAFAHGICEQGRKLVSTAWLSAALFAVVALAAIAGGHALMQADPWGARSNVKQSLAVLQTQWRDGDVLYVGRNAAPVVRFYQTGEVSGYRYGICPGAYFEQTLDECAADVRDKIRVAVNTLAQAEFQEARLFLLFHDGVSPGLIADALARHHDAQIEVEPIFGNTLHIVTNLAEISANAAIPDEDKDLGKLIASDEYNVYLGGANTLTYVNSRCNRYDTDATFFVEFAPLDAANLPPESASDGFQRLEFAFWEAGARDGRTCTTSLRLPEYALERIRTGQYVSLAFVSMRVWSSGWVNLSGAPPP